MDDDRSRMLTKVEFVDGLRGNGYSMLTQKQMNELFDQFDQDGSGQISYDEFLDALRVGGPLIILLSFTKWKYTCCLCGADLLSFLPFSSNNH